MKKCLKKIMEQAWVSSSMAKAVNRRRSLEMTARVKTIPRMTRITSFTKNTAVYTMQTSY